MVHPSPQSRFLSSQFPHIFYALTTGPNICIMQCTMGDEILGITTVKYVVVFLHTTSKAIYNNSMFKFFLGDRKFYTRFQSIFLQLYCKQK